MRIDNINDETIVEVINDYNSSVGYNIGRHVRTWDRGTAKKIKMNELYEVVNTKGGRFLLEENMLLIKEAAIREALGLSELGVYNPDQPAIELLLNEGTLEDLEELLQYCSDVTLEKIVGKAIDMPIKDMTKANLIKAYSGSDIIAITREIMEETQTEKDAAPKQADAPRRRRVTTEG